MLTRRSGEIFGGLAVEEGQNDGAALLSALAAESPADESPDGRVVAVLSALRGPWALVYWQAARGRLWFGRDAVGAPLRGACVAALGCAMAPVVPVTVPSQLWRQAWHLMLSGSRTAQPAGASSECDMQALRPVLCCASRGRQPM